MTCTKPTLQGEWIMWTLTPDYIQQVKEELKGRRAAIEARIADELKVVETELAEIEQLERLAYDVAVKHLPELRSVSPVIQPAVELASLELASAPPVVEEPELEVASEAKGGQSRWRARLQQ